MALKEFLIVVLLIGVSVCGGSQTCPPEEDLPDCHCHEYEDGTLQLTCGGFLTARTIEDYRKILQENDFAAKGKFGVHFHHFTKESKLPSNVFQGFNLKRLNIQSCVVSRWADEDGGPAFVGLEDTLEKITIFNAIKEVQSGKAVMSLGHLRKLREVHFMNNHIDHFDGDWFGKGADSLEDLWLVQCHLSSIGDRAFAGLINLRKIQIKSNKISEVARSMFPNPANNLKELSLEHNNLDALPDDIFSNMPVLEQVFLQANRITHLEENVWRPVWSRLVDVGLWGNKINCGDDQFEWIFKVSPPKHLSGRCHEPYEKKGVDLRDVIKEKE